MSVLLSTAVMVVSMGIASSGTNIVGSIPCAGSATVASGDAGMWFAGQPASVRLRQTEQRETVLLLVVRTNCAYRLEASLPDPDARNLRILSASATPWTGTQHLRAGATSGQLLDPLITSTQTAFWSGPAVSRGGNNSTPDNAVLIRALLSRAPPSEDVRITISLELTTEPRP